MSFDTYLQYLITSWVDAFIIPLKGCTLCVAIYIVIGKHLTHQPTITLLIVIAIARAVIWHGLSFYQHYMYHTSGSILWCDTQTYSETILSLYKWQFSTVSLLKLNFTTAIESREIHSSTICNVDQTQCRWANSHEIAIPCSTSPRRLLDSYCVCTQSCCNTCICFALLDCRSSGAKCQCKQDSKHERDSSWGTAHNKTGGRDRKLATSRTWSHQSGMHLNVLSAIS